MLSYHKMMEYDSPNKPELFKVEKYRYKKSVYVGEVGNCAACYYCLYACPENAIKDTNPPTVVDAKCTRCMKCVEACSRNVMQIIPY